jgi:hypothetical protein
MPRGDRENWGGARTSARPDAKRPGRPKAFHTVKMPAELTLVFLDWLNAQRATVEYDSDLGRAIDFVIADLWSATLKKDE